jgi:uncharacterized phage protein (TIGR01671 family)
MNREIKFRAWDKATDIMNDFVTEINFDIGRVVTENVVMSFEGCELMQYTGLKDKNGVEIYEGDIIKIPCLHPRLENSEYDLAQVVYVNGSPCYQDLFNKKQEYICLYIGNADKDEDAEIITNIFKNPELLKQEAENGN